MEHHLRPVVPALRRYASGLLGDREEADDLVQDCLERVISRWHQRRSEDSTRAWIFSILHNLAMTRLRRARRRTPHLPLDDAGERDVSVRASQEDHLRYRDLLATLAQLPEDQRAVLLLVAVEKFSYAETARALDVPLGTVMSRLSRARERLSKLILMEAPLNSGQPRLRSVK
jgi:RNA polymerase sigma-70 factor (ECF subfamily)